MANINVDKMPLKELLELEGRLKKAIVAARDRERSEVKQKIEGIVQSAGFTIGELYGQRTGGGRAAKASGAKYVNPDNRNETWTGRGRKPNWLVERLGNGAQLSDFAV